MKKDEWLKYDSSMDALSDGTKVLIERAAASTKSFVKHSPKLSDTTYLTRAAHSKSYAYVNATFFPNNDLLHDLGLDNLFNVDESLLIRFSNANNVITEEKNNFPAYGMSLKFGNGLSYPLVNFPLFPTDDVDSFLKVFIDLNEARVAQAQKGWAAIAELPSLLSSTIKAMYHINPLNLGNVMWKGLQMEKDFVLNYGYHGIGCYRFGDYVAKIHTQKLNFEFTDGDKDGTQITTLQNILNTRSISFKVFIQIATDEKKTPINILSKEWKINDSPMLELGEITIPKQVVIDNSPELEKSFFNPFQNPEELQPVGRIQQTRRKMYDASYTTRTTNV